MSQPLVSIIVRSFNEAWALRETLSAIQAQEYREWELIVIDSGSTDGSADLIRQARPRHFIQIKPEAYNPSRVMNRGMELAAAQFGIFLNADATPQGQNWLGPLVSALQEPRTAAVFGKQIPRPNCKAVFAHDYERCFGPKRESEKWEHFFSMVSSGIRKEIWARRGFLEKMQYSEDDEYSTLVPGGGLPSGVLPGVGGDALPQLHAPAGLQTQLRGGARIGRSLDGNGRGNQLAKNGAAGLDQRFAPGRGVLCAQPSAEGVASRRPDPMGTTSGQARRV